MSVLRLLAALLLVTIAQGQERTVKRPPAALISCTSEVPAMTCTKSRGAFYAAQQTSKAMLSVKVVLASRKAFKQESDELQKKLNVAAQSNSDSLEKGKTHLPSPFEHSILFELGEDGFITKVVVCVDLFNEVDVDELEKTEGRAPNPVYFDRNSAMTWATYVMGYVDGYYLSRTRSAALTETTHQK
jgi:hypothetical protein